MSKLFILMENWQSESCEQKFLHFMAFNLLKKSKIYKKNFIIINERCIKINWSLDSPARQCEKR